MADQIHIRDLHLRTVIGVNEEKRRDKQNVLINLVLDTDTRAAGRSDDVADTLNYRTLTKRIIELVENSQFCLVGKLAAEIARLDVQPVKWQSLSKTNSRPHDLRLSLRSSLCDRKDKQACQVYNRFLDDRFCLKREA